MVKLRLFPGRGLGYSSSGREGGKIFLAGPAAHPAAGLPAWQAFDRRPDLANSHGRLVFSREGEEPG